MTTVHKSVRAFIWALCLIAGSSYGQSSLPLKAGQVFVDRIDVASNKKIRLPEGRWVVMGLHTREAPLTGGTRKSQTVEHVSLMNENESAPLQYLSIAWTTFANVNWTAQPCDSSGSVKNRPIKDTFNTNTSSITIKCSASIYDSNFGSLNNYSSTVPLRKDLWQPIAEHRRLKPQNVVDVYGYISKHRNDFIAWNLYINPEFYGLDQASDTRYKVPANSREIIAKNLLEYASDWNKRYIQEIEKDFFPGLFQTAAASVDRFNFQERIEPIKASISSQTPTKYHINDQSVAAQSQLPPCQGDVSRWDDCFGLASYGGDLYEGTFKNGKMDGKGRYKFTNGNTYVGEFKDGLRNGEGTTSNIYNRILASGRWKDGQLEASYQLDSNSFQFNAPIQTASATPILDPLKAERDRLTAEVETERRKRQELEQQLASSKERDRISAELEAERRKLQELEAQLLVQPQPLKILKRNVHALVIGNGAYPGSGRLDNPVNDANAISQKLRSMGFTVTTVTDTNRQTLVQSMAQFRRSAAAADLSLLFYAGHGVQIFGTNYILPTDVDQTDPAQATIQGVSLNSVVENFLPGKTKLVFLDACRDNALQRTNERSVSKGLAPISAAEGTLISYATKDGQTAADGVGSKNSPFTQALLEHLNDPHDIAVVLRKVREKVMKATGGKQQPWEYGSLTGGELVLSRIQGAR